MSRDNPLHRARLERGLDLAEVARRTCLSPHVVQKIDAGRFAELPRGVYARSYVRAFATAVDLDPAAAIAEVGDSLPPAEDPLPQLRDVARRSTPGWLRAVETWVAAVRALVPSAIRRRPEAADSNPTCGSDPGTLGAPAEPFTPAEVLRRLQTVAGRIGRRAGLAWNRRVSAAALGQLSDGSGWTERLAVPARRAAAIAVDGALLVLLYGLLTWLAAITARASVTILLQSAGIGVTAVWGILVLQYFVLLGGLGGRTPGAWLFRLRRQVRAPQAPPLGLRAILSRTMLY